MTHYKKHKLYKRSDGRWQIKYSANGKPYYVYGRTQRECCDNYDKAITEQKHKTKKIMFFDWIDYYLSNYATKLKSFYTIQNLTKNYLYKYFENKSLQSLTVLDIDNALNQLETTRTKQYVYQLLHKILTLAYKKQIIKTNIAELIEPVKYKSSKGKVITKENLEKIFTYCKDTEVLKLLKFYYLTGVRKSEAFIVQFADINYEKNYIHIRGTKREHSDRYIPIFRELKDLLSTLTQTDENAPLFKISDRQLKQCIAQIKNDAGINFSIKDFRTTFASRCFEIGINEKVLQEWMGHAQSSTTKDYYVFVQDDLRQENINKFDYLFDYFLDKKNKN